MYKQVIVKNKSKQNELEKNLIHTNYILSGKEVLNPNIYKKKEKALCFLIYNKKEIIGGIKIILDYYNWAYIDLTWVKKEYRRQGFGSQIMQSVIKYAKEKQLIGIKAETWDFQAKGFYEKHGFKVYGELENHPQNIKEYYMCLYLNK